MSYVFFENPEKIDIISKDDESIWHFYRMNIYDKVNRDTSFTIELQRESGNDDYVRLITFYPMLESIPQALEEQDFYIKD